MNKSTDISYHSYLADFFGGNRILVWQDLTVFGEGCGELAVPDLANLDSGKIVSQSSPKVVQIMPSKVYNYDTYSLHTTMLSSHVFKMDTTLGLTKVNLSMTYRL